MLITNETKQTLIAHHAQVADTFLRRVLGLMGRRSFDPYDGLLFFPCNSIHTCFMRFPLDIVFLDRNKVVLSTRTAMPPWRLSRLIPKAYFTLELPVQTVPERCIELGDQLGWGISHSNR